MTLAITSSWRMLMYCSSCITVRVTMSSVSTIPKPEKTAPATKYGGKIVACQPGSTDVAKSMLTIVWTEITSGVASPARIVVAVSYRDHVRAEPFHPRLKRLYTSLLEPAAVRSRSVAKSGIIPRYQNTSEIVRYVLIANTSHRSGDRKFTQSGPRAFGYGMTQKASHGRPM